MGLLQALNSSLTLERSFSTSSKRMLSITFPPAAESVDVLIRQVGCTCRAGRGDNVAIWRLTLHGRVEPVLTDAAARAVRAASPALPVPGASAHRAIRYCARRGW